MENNGNQWTLIDNRRNLWELIEIIGNKENMRNSFRKLVEINENFVKISEK